VSRALDRTKAAGSPSDRRILSATAGLLSTHRYPIERNGCSSNRRTLIVTIAVYLIAAAVVVCGCLFFITRARSRD
jgi:hypothetical protein